MLTSEWKIDKAIEVSKKEKTREIAKNLLGKLPVEEIANVTKFYC